MLVRRVARPLLAAIFVAGGIDTLRTPQPRAAKAGSLAEKVGIPTDDVERYTKIDAAAKVGAGLMLATGRLPRLSALVLVASMVPTTLAGHPFWEETDKESRKQQRTHFLKNLGLVGGLLLAVVDTGGRESLPHRLRRQVPVGG